MSLKEHSLDKATGVETKPLKGEGKGLTIKRILTKPGVHPFDAIQWEKRTAAITNDKGEIIFEQHDVEFPSTWSMTATNVVVSKYFSGKMTAPTREKSLKELITRVAKTITGWGKQSEYFATPEDAEAFEAELTALLVNQKLSFNSPVWFNCGIEAKPQCSACFINSVEDTMQSILNLAVTEGMLFKYGSGTGSNLSPLRSSKESLTSGGKASGPVSFMKGFDAFAGVIKSGGKTRRAAKMVILNIDHPDIEEFIKCKAKEEKKAWALIDAGYDGSFGGEAYESVFFQNSNNSVRVTDDFMRAVIDDKTWQTRSKNGKVMETFKARELMNMIGDAAWDCGDPGLQFDTTINEWHTCSNTAPINASNPCSEYMFLDDSACNLASMNILKFIKEDGTFNIEEFRHGCKISIIAQEIIVSNSLYPTEKISKNSELFRPLGLGYANLGAYLMQNGLPYDSDEGRATAATITAIMTGEAYRTSAQIAQQKGPFEGYLKNREPFLKIINKHWEMAKKIDKTLVKDGELIEAAKDVWEEAFILGQQFGFRNAQTSVLAPTGTIGFMMDCDTTGIEPDIALVKYKKLAGGGLIKIVNQTVPAALKRLGYSEAETKAIINYINENDTIEGAPYFKEKDLLIFDCAFKPAKGQRFIHYTGHVKMMSAVQPFISGAISKTVNMPNEATPRDIIDTYILAWKLGLKAVALYRDGCKKAQPLNVKADDTKAKKIGKPVRRRLPDERQAITHKFNIAGHEGYITVGMYEDGDAGEIFIVMAKEGSTISGLMDTVATMASLALQYGVPLKTLVDKFSHTRFEPSGFTGNPQIPIAKSIIDYVFRWLGSKFLADSTTENASAEAASAARTPDPSSLRFQEESAHKGQKQAFELEADAPACSECGSIMVRNGSCYKCLNCGGTSGCS